MRQVVQSARTGRLSVREVPDPRVRSGHLLVTTRASLISAGTERMVVQFARKSLAGKAKARPDLVRKVLDKARRDGLAATMRAILVRLHEPLPLGYSAAGEVKAVGAGLEGLFRTGDRVAVAGAGLANHAELNVVPRSLAAPIPDDVPDDDACYGTVAAIALHAVRNLGLGLGDVAAVIGIGLVGQLAAQLLALSGARVLALDYDRQRLDLAQRLGAEVAFDLSRPGLDPAVSHLTRGLGCDGVLIAAAADSSEPFHTAAAIARDRARVTMVGLTGTAFPYQAFMKKELNIVVSRSYGPGRYDGDFEGRAMKYPEGWVRWTETENLAECVRLMSPAQPRRLDVASLTTHRFPLGEAEEAYALVSERQQPHLGVVLTYPRPDPPPRIVSFPSPRSASKSECVLGVIGAGDFAKSVLLPELKRIKGVRLHTLVTLRGTSADHGQQAYGFTVSAGDVAAVFDAGDINAVLVATRHDSHAELTARALEAGKAVLVEKPLALSIAELNRVVSARNDSDAFFQVDFNRRYAPLIQEARTHIAGTSGPRLALLRVNAGRVSANHWVHAVDEGGGRILGEVCHFVDLARYLIGAEIGSVQAEAAQTAVGSCDDVSISLRFRDGSLATIVYTALGDEAFGKERVEVYAGGSVVTVDNFRSLTVAQGGRLERRRSARPDKGFKGALRAFVEAVIHGRPAPVHEAELVETSLATIAVMESLRAGQRVNL